MRGCRLPDTRSIMGLQKMALGACRCPDSCFNSEGASGPQTHSKMAMGGLPPPRPPAQLLAAPAPQTPSKMTGPAHRSKMTIATDFPTANGQPRAKCAHPDTPAGAHACRESHAWGDSPWEVDGEERSTAGRNSFSCDAQLPDSIFVGLSV